MGYKSSIDNFEKNYLEWCKIDFWKELEGKNLFEVYGQVKLDCLLAEGKYKEQIGMGNFREDEKEYHEFLELSERAKRVSNTVDGILFELINW